VLHTFFITLWLTIAAGGPSPLGFLLRIGVGSHDDSYDASSSSVDDWSYDSSVVGSCD